MRNNEWEKIQSIFHDALELPNGEREAFVRIAANDNAGLIHEVYSFLQAFEDGPTILDEPAFRIDDSIIDDEKDEAVLTGKTIGKFRIGSRLGRGGMGDVYYAEDDRLNRPVALKFLSPDVKHDDSAKSQLRREAKSLSVLKHPNICEIFGVGDEDEQEFIVMEYVDGDSLSTLIRESRLKEADSFAIGMQIVNAIAAAHKIGIVHCDIKPGNVMITSDGEAKVLDFGLAQVVRDQNRPVSAADQITQAAITQEVRGTIAYMSPEQHIGHQLDYRTDVFSLGTLLYELSAGVNPFEKESISETKGAILDGDVTFGNDIAARFPHGLKRIIKKCLESERDKRYEDAIGLQWDLQHLQSSWLRATSRKYASYAIAGLLFLAMLSTAYYFRNDREYSVAIMPFANETGDVEFDYLADGVAENLVDRMEGANGFTVVPYSKLRGYSLHSADLDQVARVVKADLILTGRIVRNDGSLGVETKLIDASDGATLRNSDSELKADDIQSAENKILEKLFLGLDLRPFEPLENAGNRVGETKIPEAFRQYLIGRNHWKKRDRENIQQAIAAYQRAIDLDPRYARAYAGMAECWVMMSSVAYGSVNPKDAFSRARAAAKQALEIDSRNAEARTALGVVFTKHDWKWQDAEIEYRKAIEYDPDYAAAYYWLSGLLGITGRAAESITAAEKARELDPFSPLAEYNLSRSHYFARQWDKSLEFLNRISESEKNDTRFLYQSGLILLQMGKHEEALRSFQAVAERNKMLAAAAMGQTLAKMGRIKEARELVAELERDAKQTYVPPQEMAIIYIGLNERDRAFHYLNEAYNERYGSLSALKVEPLFDGVRDDPRFTELLVQMGLN